MKSLVEHEEVPKEESVLETFGALKKRPGDRHLAIGHHQKPKKRAQGNGGSQKKLAAACRGMTCHAIPARVRGMVIRDKARTRLYKEPRKD
jgi:hypothetical protein